MNKNKKINREKLENSQKLNKIFAEGKIKKACKKSTRQKRQLIKIMDKFTADIYF
ncbi:hypothetical protein [Methanobrevibacter sp.]|uniref:hypothetical protein n=1 Tax=Methanobrevibacter sp. TaxID=66852 RepID=UPI0038905C67